MKHFLYGFIATLLALIILDPDSKRGRCFSKNSLSSILTNEKYVGCYIFNKRQEKTVEGKRNPTLKPKEEWIVIEGGIPAIIDQETFDAVQEKLSRNKRKYCVITGSFKAKETYLLSGLIFCGECGEAMHGNKHLRLYNELCKRKIHRRLA